MGDFCNVELNISDVSAADQKRIVSPTTVAQMVKKDEDNGSKYTSFKKEKLNKDLKNARYNSVQKVYGGNNEGSLTKHQRHASGQFNIKQKNRLNLNSDAMNH